MSYDLRLYFPQTQFPHEEWSEILHLFDAEENKMRPCPDCRQWTVDTYTVVWVKLSPVNTNPAASFHLGPAGAHWQVVLTANNIGRTARSIWTQFAIAYHALSYIPGVTVENSENEVGHFHQAEAFQEYAGQIMSQKFGTREFVQHNLLTLEGSPIF